MGDTLVPPRQTSPDQAFDAVLQGSLVPEHVPVGGELGQRALLAEDVVGVEEQEVVGTTAGVRDVQAAVVAEVHPRFLAQLAGDAGEGGPDQLLGAVGGARVRDDPGVHETADGGEAALDDRGLVLDDHAQADGRLHGNTTSGGSVGGRRYAGPAAEAAAARRGVAAGSPSRTHPFGWRDYAMAAQPVRNRQVPAAAVRCSDGKLITASLFVPPPHRGAGDRSRRRKGACMRPDPRTLSRSKLGPLPRRRVWVGGGALASVALVLTGLAPMASAWAGPTAGAPAGRRPPIRPPAASPGRRRRPLRTSTTSRAGR